MDWLSESCFATVPHFHVIFFIVMFIQRWALQLAQMYMKWAERQGYTGRIVERYPSINGELKYASIELEFKFAYGYLSGERGVHSLIRCSDSTSALPKVGKWIYQKLVLLGYIRRSLPFDLLSDRNPSNMF